MKRRTPGRAGREVKALDLVPTILGIDLSLNAPAAVVLSDVWSPGVWDVPSRCWKRDIDLLRKNPDPDAWSTEARWALIVRGLLEYADTHHVTRVAIEEYAFAAQASAGRALAEIGGIVKFEFWKRGLRVTPIPASSARKTLLGKVPSKKTSGIAVKDYVNKKLADMGANFATMDEGDAFVIANAMRASLGLFFIGVA